MFKAENFKNNTQYKHNELYRSDLDLFVIKLSLNGVV